MKKTKLARLLAPLGSAVMLLALILCVLSLFSEPSYVAASQQTIAPIRIEAKTVALLHGSQPATKEDEAIQGSEVPPISNIIGATYDEARGEVIIFGIADPDLPPLTFDYIRENLVVALRDFYDSGGLEIPGVSIEGTLDPLDVIYFGGVTNTRFGQVSFETDRLLKTYTMGVDNLTGITVTSEVEGYMSYPDRMRSLRETVTGPVLIRYFYTPTLLVEHIDTPPTIVFSGTHRFFDWAYMSRVTSRASSEAAQGFVDNFNEHYLDYAAERRAEYGDTTLYEMPQLSKLTAIAKWAHDRGLELDLPGLNGPWLSQYPVGEAATVTQTRGITVTWAQEVSGTRYQFSLRGGVYAIGAVIEIPATERSRQLANGVYEGRQPPLPPPMMYVHAPNLSHPFGQPNRTLQVITEGPCVAYVIPLADNAVANGDFEDGPGNTIWEEESVFPIIRSDSPHNGAYGAIFPVYHNAQVALHQTLYIPADPTMARLTYWRAAATDETTHPHDFFASFLTNVDGEVLTRFEELDDRDADGFWHEVSFDVSAFAGRTVQLWFTATTDAANITNFFVDDVSLDYLDLVPPTVVGVVAPDKVAADTVEFVVVFDERMRIAAAPTVTISAQGSHVSYTLSPRTGAGYTNGYLDSDPTRWHGTYTFTPQMEESIYALAVSSAQDLAGNVMYPMENTHAFMVDVTPPQVQHKFPPKGATGVSLDTAIVISFTEMISTSTFAYTMSPDPGGWVDSWGSAQDVVTLAHHELTPGTTYTVTVMEAKDLAGNSLNSAPLVWSFTTRYSVYLPTVLRSFVP